MKVDPWPRLDRFKEHTLELPVGDLVVSADNEGELRDLLAKALDVGKGVMHLLAPLTGLHGAMLAGTPTRKVGAVKVFSTKRACPTCGKSYPELDPRMFSYNSKHGWCTLCVGTGLQADARAAEGLRRLDQRRRRPRPRAELPVRGERGRGRRRRAVPRVRRHAPEPGLAQGDVRRAVDRLDRAVVGDRRAQVGRGAALDGRDAEIARDVVSEIKSRLEFLEEVGLGYLTLDRAAPTLSGGEAQRIRLAAQLGSNLQGVCYVLDEPTIGLHSRDNAILLDALGKLADKGNTLVVVEHDEETIRRADHIIDIGPGAGKRGGRLVGRGQRERARVARRFGHRPLPRASARPSAAAAPAGLPPTARPSARRAPPTRC